jgi:hypothetical protein
MPTERFLIDRRGPIQFTSFDYVDQEVNKNNQQAHFNKTITLFVIDAIHRYIRTTSNRKQTDIVATTAGQCGEAPLWTGRTCLDRTTSRSLDRKPA